MIDSFNSSDMKLHFVLEEAILAIVVQVIGMFLIVSSVIMFIKQASLHKLENVLQMNLLLCSTVFLVIDWTLTLPGTFGCEVFSVVFIMFGTACTYTTAGIALLRFKRMMQIAFTISLKISTVLSIITIWTISLLSVLYLTIAKTMYVAYSADTIDGTKRTPENCNTSDEDAVNMQTICFFNDGLLYRNLIPSLCYVFIGIIIPIIIMVFVYIKIYQKVRKARISRWMNHVAMERSQQTAVIHLQGRKANVFQLSSSSLNRNSSNADMPDSRSYRRERSVLTKGIFAVLIVLLCWVPLTSVWLHLALGFEPGYMIYFRYLMIIAKVSVILNISHYICFNTKYRNLYMQTAFAPFTNILRLLQAEVGDDNSSHMDSQIASYSATSNVIERPIFTLQTYSNLTPIHENITKESETTTEQSVKNAPKIKIQRRKFSQGLRLQRSASMPEKFRRTSKLVHPVPLRNISD